MWEIAEVPALALQSDMMPGILVSIHAPTAEGRLYPHYQNSIGILTLASDTPRPCPFGANIDGAALLDFDETGLLACVELLVPPSRWKGKAAVCDPGGSSGNLVLASPHATPLHFGWPVSVSKDVHTDAARIDFGTGDYDRPVRLSEACCALLLKNALVGFWFSLRR